jgi:HTH-type transcriptional regulator/antitoxin HigA
MRKTVTSISRKGRHENASGTTAEVNTARASSLLQRASPESGKTWFTVFTVKAMRVSPREREKEWRKEQMKREKDRREAQARNGNKIASAAAGEKIPEGKPHEIVQFLMAQKGMKQADLVPVIGSRSQVSDLVDGKRGISKAQAKKLANFFQMPVEVFL